MDTLRKANVEKLFKNIIEKSAEITIEERYTARCEIIAELTTLLISDYRHFFSLDGDNLEDKIAAYKKSFKESKKDDYFYYRNRATTEKEYVKERLYSEHAEADTFLLEKYKSTKKIAKEVILCDLKLSWAAQTKITFVVFFNDKYQLCFDFITRKSSRSFYGKSLKKDIKMASTTSSVEAIKKLLASLPEEAKKIEAENEVRRQINEKKQFKRHKVDVLSSKAVVSKIKHILDEKDFVYDINEQTYIIKIILKMKKGTTTIRMPKKDIKTRFDILSSLCEKILEADELGIQCKYQQQ